MTRRPSSSNRPHAFTLIELLVVISIIALLIGILLPALGAARRTSRAMACSSNLKQQGIAMYVYTEDNGGSLPWGMYGLEGTNDTTDYTLLLMNAMGASYKHWRDLGEADAGEDGLIQIYSCPEALQQEILAGGGINHIRQYATHPRLMPVGEATNGLATQSNSPFASAQIDWYAFDRNGKQQYLSPTRLEFIKNSSSLFGITDTTQNPDDGNNGGSVLSKFNFADQQLANGAGNPPWLVAGYPGFNYDNPIDVGTNEDVVGNFGMIRFRHPGDRANFLFMDGHASSLGYKGDPYRHELEAENVYVDF